MKKIISEKSSLMQTSGLRAKLKGLVLDHHSDVAELDIEYFHIREAWALSEDRVKVTCDLDLKSGHCRVVTRIVPFTLPAETETVYRDWTIVIKPTWYGFGYRLLDENGAVAGESSRDWGERAYVEENAQREVNRLIAERLPGKVPSDYVQNRAPAGKPIAPETSEVDVEVLPASLPAQSSEFPAPYPGSKSDQLIVRKEARSVPLPAIVSDAGDQARWRFIEFFTATIRNRHTRRAYYNAVTQFFDWLGLGGVTSLGQITPSVVGAYIEQHPGEPPTVKQHLAAVCCHTWRATGITAYLLNGGALETAQAIANHESPRTTKLYDRTGDEITLDEVERIRI